MFIPENWQVLCLIRESLGKKEFLPEFVNSAKLGSIYERYCKRCLVSELFKSLLRISSPISKAGDFTCVADVTKSQ